MSAGGRCRGSCGLVLTESVTMTGPEPHCSRAVAEYIERHLLTRFSRVVLVARISDSATSTSGSAEVPLPARTVLYPLGSNRGGVRRHRLDVGTLSRLWRLPADLECAAVFLPGFMGSVAAGAFAARGLPYWVHSVGPVRVRGGFRGVSDRLRRHLGARAIRRAAFVIASGPELEREAQRANARVVRAGLRNAVTDRRPAAVAMVALNSPIRLVCMGSLVPDKRVEDVISALQILVQDLGFDCVLRVMGGGDRDRLSAWAERLGVGDRVHFEGHMGDPAQVAEVLRTSDLMLFASLNEGMPRALVEAMAFGVPVVTTAPGSVVELVQNRLNGMMVPMRSPAHMAAAAAEVLSDDGLRERLLIEGRHAVEGLVTISRDDQLETCLREWFGCGRTDEERS